MKRILLLLITTAIASFQSIAQTKISFDSPDVSFTFRRCTCKGNIAYIDFLITNNGSSDLRGSVTYGKEPCSGFPGYYTAAYDDEGNVYTYNADKTKLSRIDIANEGPKGYISDFSFHLPSGIPVKMRITLSGVDEYATEISLLKVSFRSMNSPNVYGIALLEAKNLPIERE